MYRPLADRIRPTDFDDVCGQTEILGKNGLLRRAVETEFIPNMIFYGPPGTGKTTVAGIIAAKANRKLYKLNATTASVSDIKSIIDELDTMLAPNGVLLYLDEIQYFSKKQQQSLLEFIENGKITLIASTTENPYFYIYNAILSRSAIFEFKPLETKDVLRAVERGFDEWQKESSVNLQLEDGVAEHIAKTCGGDVRKAINCVELLANTAKRTDDGKYATITFKDTELCSRRSSVRYDKDGDSHYDLLSAFHKSLRGSDPSAAVYYLAKILSGGDLPSACRRMLAAVSEDVGLAYPQAAVIVKSCVDSALQLGMPEARLPLAQAALLIATAPKSNSVVTAIDSAMQAAEKSENCNIPDALKDSHYSGAAQLGHGLSYKYPHNFKNNWVEQQYLPDAIKGESFYTFGSNKFESQCKAYWDNVKQNRS